MRMKNSFTHALMFHHFHDDKHPVSQGSLSGEQFELILDWTSENLNLMDAQQYADKLQTQDLLPTNVCIRNIQAFFFIYSSPFFGDPDPLEVYRYFRNTCFPGVDEFYRLFFERTKSWFPTLFERSEQTFDPDQYLSTYGFYSRNDKWFRYL